MVGVTDYRPAAREAAARHNVPPALFERQIQQESGFDPNAVSPAGASGIAQLMPKTALWLGVDPLDPLASLDAAAGYLDRLHRQYGSWRLALAAYNAGEGNVQTYGGVPPFPETQHYLDVILGPGWPEPAAELAMPTTPRLRTTEGLYLRNAPTTQGSQILATMPKGAVVDPLDTRAWRKVRYGAVEGWAAADFLEAAPDAAPAPPPSVAYNPDFLLRLQIANWACSIRTTQMLLESIGVSVDIGTLQDQMVPRYVNSDVGLRDGSGAGIVALMRDSYGVAAESYSPATWDGVTAVAGTLPIGLGLHNWGGPGLGHWAAIRRYRDGVLEVANPGGTGVRFGQQTLDRAGFDARGPASAVVVTGRT